MTSRIPLLLLLLLSPGWLFGQLTRAQTADDYFHGGAMFYLSNNVPQALQVVTNGLQQFPDDVKLKKLWELLNQKQQSQNQQQQQQQQEQKQEQKQDQPKQDQPKQQPPQPGEPSKDSKGDEKKQDERKEVEAHPMTEQEAKQLLDAQKGDEQVLQFRPADKPKDPRKVLKDW